MSQFKLRSVPKRLKVAVAILWMVTTVGREAWAQNAPLFHFTLPPGSYAVGLKVIEQYEDSRIYLPLTDDLGKPRTAE